MSNVLVISYSQNGTTRRVADQIATALGADCHEIFDATPRKGVLGYLQSGFESVAKGLPSIRLDVDPANYQLVVLGTPVWAGSMASPMRSFLFLHGHRIGRVACFCTLNGHGASGTLREMRALADAPQAPVFSITGSDLRAGRKDQELQEFVGELQELARSTVSIVV